SIQSLGQGRLVEPTPTEGCPIMMRLAARSRGSCTSPWYVPISRNFSRLAGEATLIPVVKSVMADLLTPVSAFLAIAANEPDSFLLESVERGEQIGRYTFLGARPYMRITARGESIWLERGKRKEQRKG